MIDHLKDKFWHFCTTQPKKAACSIAAVIVVVLVIGNVWSLYASNSQAQIAHCAELARLDH